MPLSSLLDSAIDSTQVLQQASGFSFLSTLPLRIASLSRKKLISAKVHPAILALVTYFPTIPTLTLGFRCVHSSLMISHNPFHLFLFPYLYQHKWNSFPFLWENFVLSTVQILQHLQDHLCLLELSTLDPVWVQRSLLLRLGEQLLLSTADTYPTVTVGVDSVALLQGEAVPTPPS